MKLFIFSIAILIVILILYFNKKQVKAKKQIPFTYKGLIVVNLDECEILSSTLRNEEPQPNIMLPFSSALNLILSRSSERDKTVSYIRFKKDGRVYISDPINKSQIGVKAALIQKKTTNIYFDENNMSNYYFDTNFMCD